MAAPPAGQVGLSRTGWHKMPYLPTSPSRGRWVPGTGGSASCRKRKAYSQGLAALFQPLQGFIWVAIHRSPESECDLRGLKFRYVLLTMNLGRSQAERPHTMRSHVYKIPRTDRPVGTESGRRMLGAGAGGNRRGYLAGTECPWG